MTGFTGLKTLLIGIDAGCYRVLEPLIDRDVIPCLERIITSGTSGVLRSQIPPWTASAWPSLYTGVNPGKHGTFDFLTFEGYEWQVVDATYVREYPVWELLDFHGVSSVVVNVPVTHPPRPFNGALIPGYIAPENPECHPNGILEEMEASIGDYRIYPDLPNDPSSTAAIDEYRSLAKLRGQAFTHLVERFDPDFGFVQFQVTDTVLHEFPGELNRAADVYAAVDQAISEILDSSRPDSIIVASDHGMDAYSTRFHANEFLRDHEFVTSIRGGDGMPAWWDIREQQLRRGKPGIRPQSMTSRAWFETLLAMASRAGFTAQRVGSMLNRIGLRDHVERYVPMTVIHSASEQVDFQNSIAYVRSRPECGIRINLADREPNGVVTPSDYDDIRSELVGLLTSATARNGEPAFESVGYREDYFEGPYLDAAPDIVTVPNEFDVYVTKWLATENLESADQTGWDHTREGIFAAVGSAVETNTNVEDAHLFDVAPTVLSMLGVPRSDRMDGSPLPCVRSAGETTYPPYESEPGQGVNDTDVEERLATLGYLE